MKRLLVAMLLFLAVDAGASDLLDDMQQAIKNGNSDTVQELLGRGFDANASDKEGNTLLMQAVKEGQGDIVRALVDAGAQLDARNRYGETPLMLAAIKGQKDIALYLLDKGASLKQTGWTPLLYAAFGGQADTAELFLARGADPNERAPNGTTPLMLAAKSGSVPLVDILLQRGANPLLKNDDNRTAADWGKDAKNTDAAKKVARAAALLSQGLEAAQGGQLETLRQSLDAGLNPNATDMEGNSLLLIVARQGFPTLAELLLQRGAKPALANPNRETPLSVAAYEGHGDTVQVLLKYGASLKETDPDALLYATMNCWDGAAKVLMDNGADLNRQDAEGHTALIFSARNGCIGIARMLLERGADDQIADKSGKTALAWAQEAEDGTGVADLLAAATIRRFVRQWFLWMDQLADDELYLGNLDERDLVMKQGEKTLRSRADFQKWYQVLRTSVEANTHLLGDITVAKNPTGAFDVSFTDTWQATTYAKEHWEYRFVHHWEVTLAADGRVVIHRYTMEKEVEAPPPEPPKPAS